MKNILLRFITLWTRLVKDDWRLVLKDTREKINYTQTMCYAEIK